MKKILAIFILSMVFITGCSNNSSYNSYLEQGKTSIINSEYEKAAEFFKLALEEESKSKEAKMLYEQTENLVNAIKLKEEGKVEEVVDLCDKINDIDSETNVVKNAANKVKEESNEILAKLNEKKNETKNTLINAEKLIGESKYSEAKESVNDIIKKIGNDERLKEELDKANDLIKICNDKIEVENKKKEDVKKQKAESSEQINSNKVYCANGNHYVDKVNYDSELGRCIGCSIKRDLSSTSTYDDCTNCGGFGTVSLLTGRCNQCNSKILPAVKIIHDDGTVILEDGSTW